jgi:hypothetical protein
MENKRLMTGTKKTAARNIAISLLLLLFLPAFTSISCAAETEVGRVAQLSGPLLARKADDTTRVLSVNSAVEQGDTLVTEKKTYARIKFIDASEITLRPGTQLKVSQYNFDQAKPQDDKAVYNLIKGGMRSITGLIGKRGDPGSYKLVTDTAVAGVRGTTFECKICADNCGSLPNGLYVFVIEGFVDVSNDAGSQSLGAGQYAYVASGAAIPQLLPGNPGIDFTLPKSMEGSSSGGEAQKADPGCVVR